MQILGKSTKARRQIIGNLCLVLFLAFMFSTIVPMGTPSAYANNNPPTFNVLDTKITETKAGNNTQITINMLLQPTTNTNFNGIFVDFTDVVGESKIVQATYKGVYNTAYSSIYEVNLVYDVPVGAEISYSTTPIYIQDARNNRYQTETVKLKVKPPRPNSNATISLNAGQNVFPVGSKATIDVNLSNAQNISGAQVVVRYDPDFLEVLDSNLLMAGTNIIRGAGLNDNNYFLDSVDTRKGEVLIAVTNLTANSGVNLAKIEFNVKRAGITTLDLQKAAVDNRVTGKIENPVVVPFALTAEALGELGGKVKLLDKKDDTYEGVPVKAKSLLALIASDVEATTDLAGQYKLNVLPGDYKVSVQYPRYLKATKQVQITSGQQSVNNNFDLVPGDASGDNEVSLRDLTILAREINQNTGGYHASDFNGDGKVDVLDLYILNKYYLSIGDE